MGIWSIIGIVFSFGVSVWAVMKYIISQNVRLDDNISKNLFLKIKKDSSFKFEIKNELSINKKYPLSYIAFIKFKGIWLLYKREERLLNAGWQSRDIVSEVYYLRWQQKKVEKTIYESAKNNDIVSVMAMTPWGSDKLGEISVNKDAKLYLNKESYEDIEKDVIDMLENKKEKTSCLLHGLPGGGKTRLVKYLAQKYELPIYSIFLNPEYNNIDILSMFNDTPERCIVLFEDFDNYFNKRDCIMKNDKVNFTFDVILNILDGVYNEYKQVVFVMTCNDIEKIDTSLKERPSRLKHVKEFGLPNYESRLRILKDDYLAEYSESLTLDKVFYVKSLLDANYKTEDILDRIKSVKQKILEV